MPESCVAVATDASRTPASLRRPLPNRGGVPWMEGADPSLTAARLSGSVASRRAKDELRSIRRRWLGQRRDPEMRAEGIARLGEFTEPAALLPMHEVLREEEDDVRLAMLDHFASLGSPTFDFYGADRPGANLFGNSVVALDARTGKRIWHYQTTHHDLWDYDLPAQPVLGAIASTNSTGIQFMLDDSV